MATITVRNLDDDVQQRLKARAAENHRSMEAEARAILSDAVRVDTFITKWLAVAAEYPGDFELPPRSMPREIDLS